MKQFYEKFLLFSRGKQIAVVVCLVHFLTLLILACHHLISLKLRSPRPMVVRTIVPMKLALCEASSPKNQAFANTKPTAIAPKHKPQSQKAAAGKETAPIKNGSGVKQNGKADVYKEIAESLDVISSSAKKATRPTLTIPSKVDRKTTTFEEESGHMDATYSEYLIAFLQTALDLPEYGEVKMEIEIDSFGKLVDCSILESRSKKNAAFLKKELALLSYPIPHLDHIETSKKFSITFKNL